VRTHRDRYNKQGEQHYSYQHFELYGRKCVLLQVIKYLPKSAELQNVIDLEYAAESGEPQHFSLPEPPLETPSSASSPAAAAVPPDDKPPEPPQMGGAQIGTAALKKTLKGEPKEKPDAKPQQDF
jgi:hypothetical protein